MTDEIIPYLSISIARSKPLMDNDLQCQSGSLQPKNGLPLSWLPGERSCLLWKKFKIVCSSSQGWIESGACPLVPVGVLVEYRPFLKLSGVPVPDVFIVEFDVVQVNVG